MSSVYECLKLGARVFAPFMYNTFADLCSGSTIRTDFTRNGVMFFTNNAKRPCFSASATAMLHTMRVRTRTVLLTGTISKVCSDSPGAGPGTMGCSRVSVRRMITGGLTTVSLATSVVYVRRGVPVLMFTLSRGSDVVGTMRNGFIKAGIAMWMELVDRFARGIWCGGCGGERAGLVSREVRGCRRGVGGALTDLRDRLIAVHTKHTGPRVLSGLTMSCCKTPAPLRRITGVAIPRTHVVRVRP